MNARLFRYFSAGAMLALSLGAAAPVRAAPLGPPVTTVVVKPSAMNGWVFYDDTNDVVNNSLGTFVYGPATPMTGKGSAQITISPSTPAQRTNLATYQFAGTKLADITEMKFELYNPSGKDVTTGFLNFNVDWDGHFFLDEVGRLARRVEPQALSLGPGAHVPHEMVNHRRECDDLGHRIVASSR